MISVMASVVQTAKEALVELLVPPLKSVLGPLDHWLDNAPWWAGQACAISLFLIVGIWVLTLKREYVFQGAPDESRWRDLRIWAWLAMLPFMAVYLFFS